MDIHLLRCYRSQSPLHERSAFRQPISTAAVLETSTIPQHNLHPLPREAANSLHQPRQKFGTQAHGGRLTSLDAQRLKPMLRMGTAQTDLDRLLRPVGVRRGRSKS
jgi:hypothetical protein